MIDPRDYLAFWGLCGGLLGGAVDLVAAYSAKAGNPLARRKAWLHLALGAFGGVVLAEALVMSMIGVFGFLDRKAVALIFGVAAANDPRGLLTDLKRMFLAGLREVVLTRKEP